MVGIILLPTITTPYIRHLALASRSPLIFWKRLLLFILPPHCVLEKENELQGDGKNFVEPTILVRSTKA